MSSSDPKAAPDEGHDAAQAEAQRAADALKAQIAAVRSRVRNAQEHLRSQRTGRSGAASTKR